MAPGQAVPGPLRIHRFRSVGNSLTARWRKSRSANDLAADAAQHLCFRSDWSESSLWAGGQQNTAATVVQQMPASSAATEA